jgi:hypothetical protein
MIKEIEIGKLQPTETNLRSESYYHFLSLSVEDLLEEGPAEVWDINGNLVIADAHNRMAAAYNKGQTTYPAKITEKAMPFYQHCLSFIEPRYKQAQSEGVHSVEDLLERDVL